MTHDGSDVQHIYNVTSDGANANDLQEAGTLASFKDVILRIDKTLGLHHIHILD